MKLIEIVEELINIGSEVMFYDLDKEKFDELCDELASKVDERDFAKAVLILNNFIVDATEECIIPEIDNISDYKETQDKIDVMVENSKELERRLKNK